MDIKGKMSPSSFIPFCDFGGNMSVMGKKIDQFEIPVCDKFKPKILNDRLCFQVDVNEFTDQIDKQKAMKKGLIFFMDYNEDRMITERGNDIQAALTNDLYDVQKKVDRKEDALIYIETIGKTNEINYK